MNVIKKSFLIGICLLSFAGVAAAKDLKQRNIAQEEENRTLVINFYNNFLININLLRQQKHWLKIINNIILMSLMVEHLRLLISKISLNKIRNQVPS